MKQINAIQKLEHSFIESWNDSNPIERLNPELINLVNTHLHYAFIAGLEGLSSYLIRDLDVMASKPQKCTTVGIRAMQELISTYTP